MASPVSSSSEARRLPAVLGLLAASCATFPRAIVKTREGVIQACDPETAASASELLLDFGPRVRAVLLTSNKAPLAQVGLKHQILPGSRGYQTRRGFAVPELVEEWEWCFVHELVHWNATGYWDTLPAIIEEGLCQIVGSMWDGAKTITIGPPAPELFTAAITLDQRELENSYYVAELHYQAGMWVIARLGFDQLRSLAEEAYRQDLERIPAAWFQSAIPDLDGKARIDEAALGLAWWGRADSGGRDPTGSEARAENQR